MSEVLRHEQAPSRWWLRTVWVCGAIAVVCGGAAVAVGEPSLWFFSLFAVAVAALCLTQDGLEPRAVEVDAAGVTVRSRWRRRTVGWHELRRVREAGAGATPPRADDVLERVDGDVVLLPRGLAPGTLERKRAVLGARRPVDGLPQRWVSVVRQTVLVYLSLPVVLVQVPNLLNGDMPPWLSALIATLLGVTVVLFVVALLHGRRRPRGVTADPDGLTVQGLRRRRLPWSDVRALRAAGRWTPSAVVERHDGSTVPLADVPLAVAEHWRDLAGASGPVQDPQPR